MKSANRIIHIACDGGAATGKSTGAKMISKKYKLKFLSSTMYIQNPPVSDKQPECHMTLII